MFNLCRITCKWPLSVDGSSAIVGAKQHDEADGRRSGRAGEGGESGEREPDVIAAHTRSLNLYITLA